MSVQNLKEYARQCASDPALLAKAKEFGLMNIDQHMQQAGTLGLDWTMEDMVAFRKEIIDSEGELVDLDADELEMVAGGLITTTAAVVVGGVAAGAVVGGAVGAAVGGGVAAAGDGGW